jgi:hypothetical protein
MQSADLVLGYVCLAVCNRAKCLRDRSKNTLLQITYTRLFRCLKLASCVVTIGVIFTVYTMSSLYVRTFHAELPF